MRVRHYQLTLDGTAQQLVDALPGTEAQAVENAPFRELQLQADDGNSNPIFVGGSNAVSAAAHGLRIPAPTGGVPSAPERFGPYEAGPVNLSDFWVLGTADEVLNILGVTF